MARTVPRDKLEHSLYAKLLLVAVNDLDHPLAFLAATEARWGYL